MLSRVWYVSDPTDAKELAEQLATCLPPSSSPASAWSVFILWLHPEANAAEWKAHRSRYRKQGKRAMRFTLNLTRDA